MGKSWNNNMQGEYRRPYSSRNPQHSRQSLVWLSTAYELASIAIDSDPYSKLSQLIVTWLPEYSTDVHLDSFPPTFTTSACIRLAILASLTQLSARLALKNFASFPLIPCTAAYSRVTYVPTSQIPSTLLTHDPSKPSPCPVPKKDKGRMLFTLRLSHELINRGSYHYARHPMYNSVFLAFIGSGLLHWFIHAPPGQEQQTLSACIFSGLG